MTTKNSSQRCKSTAKSGEPCRAAATEGGLCYFHSNPKKAVELGRIGGRSKNKHQYAGESAEPLPDLESAEAIQKTIKRCTVELYEGKLDPKVVTGIVSLLNLQLRAIETRNLMRRIVKGETLATEMRAALDMEEEA